MCSLACKNNDPLQWPPSLHGEDATICGWLWPLRSRLSLPSSLRGEGKGVLLMDTLPSPKGSQLSPDAGIASAEPQKHWGWISPIFVHACVTSTTVSYVDPTTTQHHNLVVQVNKLTATSTLELLMSLGIFVQNGFLSWLLPMHLKGTKRFNRLWEPF